MDKSECLEVPEPEASTSHEAETSHQHAETENLKNCRFFLKYNYCRFGDRCKFIHPFKSFAPRQYTRTNRTQESVVSERNSRLADGNQKLANDRDSSSKVKPAPICRHFKRGFCKLENRCKFRHQSNTINRENVTVHIDPTVDVFRIDANDIEEVKNPEPSPNCAAEKVHNPTFKSKTEFDSSSASQDEILQMRNTEITQLKKRYPKLETLEEDGTFHIIFQPSDPDWPFDLKSLKLKITFPEKYPIEICKIMVLRTSSNIPEILIRFLNRSIEEWLQSRHEEAESSKKTVLIFRSFLRWFDKNLQDLFVCGLRKVKKDMDAKESGIEFVPVEELFPAKCSIDERERDEDTVETQSDVNESDATEAHPQSESVSESPVKQEAKPVINQPAKMANQSTALNQGVKVLFNSLELVEGLGALTCTKLSTTLCCNRCKTSFNAVITPNKKRCHQCTKCSRRLDCDFSSSVLHQFSALLGTLQLVDSRAVDINLVECGFLADCLNCSKQVALTGIQYGQKQKFWCIYCNNKFIVGIGGVKFQALKPSYREAESATIKKKERNKDAVIKEGESLPNQGTCRHYKKSFRWLRFPCCGRLYPCDICHDENERDHEMKFASRMICGFCSKEQPYSKDKPCTLCSSSVVAKGGAHWEGGKGCRNKTKMSRDDKHKFAGTHKTVSKKAQATKK